jgi:hypothetical protein
VGDIGSDSLFVNPIRFCPRSDGNVEQEFPFLVKDGEFGPRGTNGQVLARRCRPQPRLVEAYPDGPWGRATERRRSSKGQSGDHSADDQGCNHPLQAGTDNEFQEFRLARLGTLQILKASSTNRQRRAPSNPFACDVCFNKSVIGTV